MNGYNPYYGYQPYNPPIPDQLTQLRYNQGMQQGQGFQGFNQQPQPSDERIWVQGKNAAEAYLVAANGFVRLWDSNGQVFYEKRADASGRPYMETYEYKRKGTEVPQAAPENTGMSDYAKEISDLKARLASLEAQFRNGGNVNAANVPKSDANDSAVPEI